jgi:hypothetical protein
LVFLLHKRKSHDEPDLLWRVEPKQKAPANYVECCRAVGGAGPVLRLACGRQLAYPSDIDIVVFCTGYRYALPFLDGTFSIILFI